MLTAGFGFRPRPGCKAGTPSKGRLISTVNAAAILIQVEMSFNAAVELQQ